MKKWIVGVFVLLVLSIVCIYIFIPRKLQISNTIRINAKVNAVNRYLSNDSLWQKWWPRTSPELTDTLKQKNTFAYDGYRYIPTQKFFNGREVLIEHDGSGIRSLINIIPVGVDSIQLTLTCYMATTSNPLKRLFRYIEATNTKKNIEFILDHLKKFLENKEKVYTVTIQQTTVKDTLLMTTKHLTLHYPTTAEIYDLIKKLKKYILEEGARETNYPMLNVTQTDSFTYQTMVAIPIDKVLAGNTTYVRKRMVPGKILVAEVKGGVHTIDQGFAELENYLNDHDLASPAIPFQLLVTDRQKEVDTTMWVTKLYYPIY